MAKGPTPAGVLLGLTIERMSAEYGVTRAPMALIEAIIFGLEEIARQAADACPEQASHYMNAVRHLRAAHRVIERGNECPGALL